MDIISAIKAAQESGTYLIARNQWSKYKGECAGLIIMIDYPMRINKQNNRTKKGYWNPTTNDIIADDWCVIPKDEAILDLAVRIETFMFERGEYDCPAGKQICWIVSADRAMVAANINREIAAGMIDKLAVYLESQAVASRSSEQRTVAEKLLAELQALKSAKKESIEEWLLESDFD